MTRPKYLIYSFLLLLLLCPQVIVARIEDGKISSCESFKMDVSIGSSNEVEIKVVGSKGKVRFFLIDSSERLINSKDIFKNKFTGLAPGNYKVIAADVSGCSKETEFTLR